METNRRRRMSRRIAVVAAMLMSITAVAGASVLIQNFMAAEFNAGAPPCLIKTAGEDVAFEGFDFTLQTTTVDGVGVTQELVTIDGVTGDRVSATEVFVIENNCNVDLNVTIGDGLQAGNWAERYLEVHLGSAAAPTGYPGAVGSTGWDATPLVFENGGPTNATTGTVLVPASSSVPVGMIVTTGDAAAAPVGTATWTVQAETTY